MNTRRSLSSPEILGRRVAPWFFIVTRLAIGAATLGCGGKPTPPIDSQKTDPNAIANATGVPSDSVSAANEHDPNGNGESSPESSAPSDAAKPKQPIEKQPIEKQPDTTNNGETDSASSTENKPVIDDAQIGAWLKELISDDPSKRDAALAALLAWTPRQNTKHAAARLLAADASIPVRRGAAFYLLERFEPTDPRQAEGVVAALRDADPVVRRMALQLILRSKTLTVQQLPLVGKLMLDPEADAASRIKAVRGLATMPAEAAKIADVLRTVASDSAEPEVRAAAVYTISRVDPSEQGVRTLLERLKSDPDRSVRKLAAARLGRLKAPAAAEPLCAALQDADPDVAQSAADALGRLGGAAIEPLGKQLSASEAKVRKLAIFALGRNGAAAQPAIGDLEVIAQKDPDPEVRELAQLTVRLIKTADR